MSAHKIATFLAALLGGSVAVAQITFIAPYPTPSSKPVKLIQCPDIAYPPAALRAELKGVVTVQVSINDVGAPVAVEVAESSGPRREHKLMDASALNTVRQCQFTPAPGTPERTAQLAIKFTFTEEPPPSPFPSSAASK